jgi:hypothetical protein
MLQIKYLAQEHLTFAPNELKTLVYNNVYKKNCLFLFKSNNLLHFVSAKLPSGQLRQWWTLDKVQSWAPYSFFDKKTLQLGTSTKFI